jgi:acetyl coenzyme A synthetase (ADP forming)-like protein
MLATDEVVLRDGSVVSIRRLRLSDRAGLETFIGDLGRQSRFARFNSLAFDERAQADRMCSAPGNAYELVAVRDGDLVAHAEYIPTSAGRAEISFMTADRYRGLGLATLLLERLATQARRTGIRSLDAFVLPTNNEMAQVFRDSGFVARNDGGIEFEHWSLETEPTPEMVERYVRRESGAIQTSLHPILSPRSVAVIGASRTRGTIGAEIFHNLLATSFAGPVYPVNRMADVVQSVRAYRSVGAIEGPVDLAVISVPAHEVLSSARECAARGVRSLVVISAGFAEAGPEGSQMQRELVALCRASGMRLVGPNCMGVINTDPSVRLNATFAPTYPPEGRVGFLSQSGALGLAVIEHAAQRGIGLSTFVSVGNKADVSGNDLLAYWADDPRTDVILMYLESFGNPRKFSRLARSIGRSKPIVVVKSGRSVAGARATSSHTGALVASSDVTTDALFRQTGVIRTETLGELFDVSALLVNQPLPAGCRVAIVTNAGGPAILAADACEAAGLEVPALSDATRARLREFLPLAASIANPVDMIASAGAAEYGRTIGALAADESVDALIVMFTPPLVTKAADVAAAIRSALGSLERRIPVLCVFLSVTGVPAELSDASVRIPSFAYPEDAARALAHAVRYAAWRAQPEGAVPQVSADRNEADALLRCALDRGASWLEPGEVAQLFRCYGLPIVETREVRTPDDVAAAADAVGGPVALKAVAPALVHKSDAGGVRLHLQGGESARRAAIAMADAVRAHGHDVAGYIVQPMIAPGVELILGMVQDPTFGPVIACGAGGTTAELMRDVAVGVSPLTDADARQMLRSLRTFPLLDGYRGAAKCDVARIEDALMRLSAMVERHPEIVELDANPLVARTDEVTIVDARVRIARPPA